MTFEPDFSLVSDLHDSLGDISPNVATYRRRVVIILFDLSTSMSFTVGGRRRIDLLNEQLREWLPMVRREGSGQLRDVEIAVITFSGRGVQIITGDPTIPRAQAHTNGGAFVSAADLQIGELEAFGTTPMVEAINLALELAEARVRYLAEENLQTGRVRILMFTDGGPFDRDLPADAWRTAASHVIAAAEQGRIQFFAFGAPGADETVLREISGDPGYIPLAEFDFAKLLDLILIATSADDPYLAIRDQLGWEESG
jgi:uncharacterized protein YegL